MGLGMGLIGPTILKLREQTNSTLDQLGYVFFTRAFGFLGGTVFAGIIVDHFVLLGRTFLTLTILIMCLVILIMPLIKNVFLLIFVQLMWGITAGMVDNLVQILTLRHYGQHQVGPYIQAVHGAFGIGAFLSPLIVAPFLNKHRKFDQWHYAYWIIGFLHIPNLIWILFYAIRDECCLKKSVETNVTIENDKFVSEDDDNKQSIGVIVSNDPTNLPSSSKIRPFRIILIISSLSLFLLLHDGSESAFGAYLHTYASLHLNFLKDIAAYLNSAFWASFAFGRLCRIPLSTKLSSFQMIFIDLIGCISSLVLLFIFNKSSTILWISSILFELSIASIYPSTIFYTEEHIKLTGKRMSMLTVGASTGGAVIPLLIGFLL
ncbi:unnamed protein product [Rotaria sordida]|uniref:Major facilitator superfamily domain-containing protein 4A n=1 Tax=Rotaria sordida TaxID=392033 RepID=A0A819T274_9BILA|nr:unnamed protein product [Rotaria sordida]